MRKYNLSKIIKLIEIILVAIVLLTFTVAINAINQFRGNSLSTITSNYSSEVMNISRTLSGIHSMMLTEVGYDKDLDRLLVDDGSVEASIERITIKSRIKTMISSWAMELPYSVHYAIYFPSNGIIIEDSNTNEDYILWRSIKEEVISKIDTLDIKSNWHITKLGEKYYFLDVLISNGRYIFAYIDIHEVIQSLESELYGQDYYITLLDQEGNSYNHQDRILEDKTNLKTVVNKHVTINRLKQRLLINEGIGDNIRLLLTIHNYNSILNVFWFQLVLVLFMIMVVTIALLILRFVNKTVLRPIEAFNKNIETIKNNEVYDVATHYQIKELGNASQLMSELVDKIKNLKIDIYEKTLEQQKTKMDFLTLQIEPHFYLNCLNIIYQMAQMKQYQEIQRLSNYVSEYLRYIFQSRDRLATVQEELEHVEKYLEIQTIRYSECFHTNIDFEDKIKNVKLPPLILQTFVENAVKHTINWDDEIVITMKGWIEEDKQEAVLIIEDTGDGYDPEILYKLQHDIDISEGKYRIGIMNTISRLKLTFADKVSLRFYNREEGGAGVEIRFPQKIEDRQVEVNE